MDDDIHERADVFGIEVLSEMKSKAVVTGHLRRLLQSAREAVSRDETIHFIERGTVQSRDT
jgi:hypothetical protein